MFLFIPKFLWNLAYCTTLRSRKTDGFLNIEGTKIKEDGWSCENSLFMSGFPTLKWRVRWSCVSLDLKDCLGHNRRLICRGNVWSNNTVMCWHRKAGTWPHFRVHSKTTSHFVSLTLSDHFSFVFYLSDLSLLFLFIFPLPPLTQHIISYAIHSDSTKAMCIQLEGFLRSYCKILHPWLGFLLSVKVTVTPTHNGNGTVAHTQTLSTPQQTLHVFAFLLLLLLIKTLG